MTTGGEWSAIHPSCTLPPGKTRYPFYRRLGGPQGQSGRAENLIPAGIWSRTVQPIVKSLYWLSYPAHALCSTKKQYDELSNTSSKSKSSSSSGSSSSSSSTSSSSSSSSDVYILSSGSLLRYSKSDFGGIHFQITNLILCASYKNMRLFIQ